MENLEKFVKAHAKAFIGLGAAAALGTAVGVTKVAKQRVEEFSRPENQRKAKALLRLSYQVACDTAREVSKDLNTVASSVKEHTSDKLDACTSRCGKCCVKGFLKGCCGKEEAPECCKTETPAADVAEEVAPEAPASVETEGLPEPVKAADVVAEHEASDREMEDEKNKKLAGPVEGEAAPAPEVKKPAATRKPRTPKAPEQPTAE